MWIAVLIALAVGILAVMLFLGLFSLWAGSRPAREARPSGTGVRAGNSRLDSKRAQPLADDLGMLANRIVNVLSSLLSPITIPLQLVTTSVGGCLVAMTFGLLLLPLSLIWLVFFMNPLLSLSWLWDRVWLLRIPLALIGVPLAVLGAIYTSLVPSMGEMDARATKLLICWTWPFSLDFLRYQSNPDWGEFNAERLMRLRKVLRQNRATEAMALRPPSC
jgi:hypothetical protein